MQNSTFENQQFNYYRPSAFGYNNGTAHIIIDSEMNGKAIDPNFFEGGGRASTMPPIVHDFSHFDPYSQGPEGVPFAPQPPQIPSQPPLEPPKAPRKKRKTVAKEQCHICEGNAIQATPGIPEQMVTCSECGRNVHPSCMDVDPSVGNIIRQYDWRCIECKICEVCLEKGDDNRILFCDNCDRGWHMDCLGMTGPNPPIGTWICPQCQQPAEPPPYPDHQSSTETPLAPAPKPEPPPIQLDPQLVEESPRQPSVASSTHSCQSPLRRVRLRAPQENPMQAESSTKSHTPPITYKRPRRQPPRPIPTPQESPPRPRRVRQTEVSPAQPTTSGIRIRLPGRNKGKMREEEHKDIFDDILGPEDRDTTKTAINDDDKRRFEQSRLMAEKKLTPSHHSVPEPPPPDVTPSSRPLRSAAIPVLAAAPSLAASQSPAPSSPGPGEVDKRALRINTIRFGEYDIKTWYDAPFPEEYASIPDGRLWICEFCLKYMKSRFGAVRHKTKCKSRHPPGDEIYRDDAISIFEVDGRKNKIYCQNLCLLSKMFLDHKSLFYDVEPFLFYVITESDDAGSHFVGYFSKEKWSSKDYNLSCIMTLPVRQRQGWGNLLMDFSYLLSKKEQRLGSPEKPLSALGALGYRNYWTLALMRYLQDAPNNPRLEDICAATSLTMEDAYNTLVYLDMIVLRDASPTSAKPSPGQSIRFPKGRKNGIARRALQRDKNKEHDVSKGPFQPPKRYSIRWNRDAVAEHLKNWEAKGYLKLKPEKLKWSPFITSRTKKTDAEGAMDISSLLTTEKLSQMKREDWPPEASIVDEEPPATSLTNSSPSFEQTTPRVETSHRRLHRRTSNRATPSFATPPTSQLPRTRRSKSDSARVLKMDDDLLPTFDGDAQNSEDSDVLQSQPPRSRSESAKSLKRRGSSRSALARKRRRVESSPEVDESPTRSSTDHPESETVSQLGPVTPQDDEAERLPAVAAEIKHEEIAPPADVLDDKPSNSPVCLPNPEEPSKLGPKETPTIVPGNTDYEVGDEDAEGEDDEEFLAGAG